MTLPHNGNQEELIKLVQSNPSLRQFHYQYNIYRVSCMSRDKLWNSVILPPRSDESPTWEIDPAEYVFRGKEDDDDLNYSIIRKEGKYLPWDSIMKPSIKPAGVLPKGRCIFNGMAPNSGVTKTQFTVKGWCNSRWVDCSQEE
ncbi:uncharacterized protein SPAPADRAFT_62189 [Spathaspora passalidarum NRRL Y-27907]|uniref:Uncharacterized protein n=1 Tax=Spathaspora passalidarum (strain NRRL Y-27907 / 11-Y1) TaxID=619300 RepID=G3AQM6_SPAPN|nr:uncharacterized protein SPAPADRAFT_62189 [Spathaspora passalidarum NRRL Y-27907]EGW31573.1 hypothetical protein SPAPADRAFT_62189 [Spathaspora passalidarum NRRL Y-27907]